MRDSIGKALARITEGIAMLREAFPGRQFTLDGRLVGDIGEVIAAIEYDLSLFEAQQPRHDAVSSDGRYVQIKATFKNSLTMTAVPDYYLGLQLFSDGRHAEVFNGPGSVIAEAFSHRRGIGTQQLSFPVAALRALSERVNPSARVPFRKARG